MSSFFKLCSCEFTKVMKKKSTKIMLIIFVLSLFASAGMAVLTKKMYNVEAEYIYSTTSYKEDMQTEIESIKAELESENLDEASKNSLQARLDILQMAIDNDINIYNDDYWKGNFVIEDIFNDKVEVYNYKSMGEEELAQSKSLTVDKEINLLKNDDFSGYINFKKEELKLELDEGTITNSDYEIELSELELKEKYEIGKTYNSDENWKATLVTEITDLRKSISYGINSTTRKAFTDKTLKKAEDNIKINEYRLEHNIEPFMTGDSSIGNTRKIYDYMMSSLTMVILAVMIIIIAGSSISSEISKGTIKFWSFTPNKRWKILLSKLCVNTFILVLTTVGITLLSTVVGNVFFGSGSENCYLYVSGDSVHSINYVAYAILYNLAVAIDIFMFLLLAMMLSTVARNTAVAVGVSIAAYLGGSTITQIFNMFITSEWIKFIPFNNLNLSDKIFTNDVSYTTSNVVQSIAGNTTVGFSLSVLAVCAVIMIVTMFDSFRKRDIV